MAWRDNPKSHKPTQTPPRTKADPQNTPTAEHLAPPLHIYTYVRDRPRHPPMPGPRGRALAHPLRVHKTGRLA